MARPSRTINKNLAFGNKSNTYDPIFNVNGSLLHKRGAGSPCFAIISRQNAAIALSTTCQLSFEKGKKKIKCNYHKV